jgi:hypothetical protein
MFGATVDFKPLFADVKKKAQCSASGLHSDMFMCFAVMSVSHDRVDTLV